MSSELFIGLMSGTSMDAVDCALVGMSNAKPTLLSFSKTPLPEGIKERLLAITERGQTRIDELGSLDTALGELFAQASLDAMRLQGIGCKDVRGIGSHGQTIWHQPPGGLMPEHGKPFTMQLGDPNIIAEKTGITTVADFRRRDLAAGGQGAPLVPAFHQHFFKSSTQNRFIVNVGGMANITFLPLDADKPNIGFDTGPGNVLVDYWIQKHHGATFDEGGEWAASGHMDPDLLELLLTDSFFSLPPPKSTGRELFNANWLESHLETYGKTITPVDIQATLLDLTTFTIVTAIESLAAAGDVIVCGGGARNKHLLQRLSGLLPGYSVMESSAAGLIPEAVEAVAFAWFAKLCLDGKPLDLRRITGARHANILGGIYQGSSQ